MPRRKQAKRTTVKDIRSILRLTQEGLSVRAISERLLIPTDIAHPSEMISPGVPG